MKNLVDNCRSCEAELDSVINFGKMPIANAFLNKKDFKSEYFFNLEATFCNKCKLFQLREQPNPKKLFHSNYAFFADTSQVMQNHFKELTHELINKYKLSRNELVVEIGNNDGGMVHYLNQKNYNCIGVDPSKNVADRAKSKGVNMINDFFNFNTSKKIKKKYGNVKYFLSANTLAHIPDINSVFEGLTNLLDDKGIFITEDPYLLDVFNKVSYDQIYDEHVFIFSINSIKNLCKKFNLEIINLKKLATAGGSMRYYIAKKGKHRVSSNVKKYFDIENSYKINNKSTLTKFRQNCEKSKNQLNDFLNKYSKSNIIVGYGSTSKSTTIFNYCNINKDQIKYLTDTTPTKINKFTPGTHIPIYDYKYFKENLPNICILLAWNHSNEIFKKEKSFFSKKGKWMLHYPYARFIKPKYL